MANKVYRLQIYGLALISTLASACTKGMPDISAVNNLPPIELTDQSKAIHKKSFVNQTLVLAGRTPRLVTGMEVSLDGGATWKNLAEIVPSNLSISNVGCVGEMCPFSYSIPNVAVTWPEVGSLQEGQEKGFLLRGISDFGLTDNASFIVGRIPGSFQVIATAQLKERGNKISPVMSGSYRIVGARIHSKAVVTTTSGGFKAQGAAQ